MEDVIGHMQLSPVLSSINSYLPFSSSTLSPASLSIVCNDLFTNNRRMVLELGSGTSTVILAKFIQKYNLKTVIVSLEENRPWHEKIQQILSEEKLLDFVKLIYAPYSENDGWYSDDFIPEFLKNNYSFDTFIIDGPQAWQKGREMSRKNALYKLFNFLTADFSVFLDDINRPGEKAIAKLWEKDFSLKFKVYNRQIAVSLNGKHYNIF